MCGLYGAFPLSETGALSALEKARLKDLAILSQLRGLDSAGLFFVIDKEKTRNVGITKDIQTTSEFITNGTGAKVFNCQDTLLIAGHSRAATIGQITKENAHPFRCDNIFGAHNGTVHSMGNANKTDSQEIFEYLNKLDHKEWPEFFIKLDKAGAYALTFYDMRTNRFYIIRNNDRTLYYLDYLQVRYYSSEWLMLDMWRKRLNLTNQAINLFEPMRLYWHDIGDFSNFGEESIEKKPSTPPWEPVKPQVFAPPSIPVKSKAQDILDKYSYMAFKGKKMSPKKAHGLLQYGCVICDKVSSLSETTYWYNNSEHICEHCREQDLFANMYLGKNSHTTLYRSKLKKEEDDDVGVSCH